jgi:hypothetical protein
LKTVSLRESGSSRTIPARTGIAPASRSDPKIVYAFESRT